MTRSVLRLFGIFIVAAVLTSCNAYFPHLRVMRANYNVSRGDYQIAVVDYLRIQELSEFQPWLSYNLGTVYHYLGESGAAVEQWTRAIEAVEPNPGFGARFNHGVYLFEQGQYDAAFSAFRDALLLDPASEAAKVNLQMTIDRIEAANEIDREQTKVLASAAEDPGTGTTRMIDYVRRLQEQRWRANSEIVVEDGVEDW